MDGKFGFVMKGNFVETIGKLVAVSMVAAVMTAEMSYGCCCWKREKPEKSEFTIKQISNHDLVDQSIDRAIEAIDQDDLDAVKAFVADDLKRVAMLHAYSPEKNILEFALNRKSRNVFMYLMSLYDQSDEGRKLDAWRKMLMKIDSYESGYKVIHWLIQENVGLNDALWFVQTPDYVERLLRTDLNVERQYGKGMTVLQYAAAKGNAEKVRLLLNARANIDHKDIYESTPLMHAVRNGHIEVVHLLVEAYKEQAERRLAILCAQEWSESSSEKISEAISEYGCQFFIQSDNGIGINACDREGHTALWHARQEKGSQEAGSPKLDCAKQIVAMLEGAGAVE